MIKKLFLANKFHKLKLHLGISVLPNLGYLLMKSLVKRVMSAEHIPAKGVVAAKEGLEEVVRVHGVVGEVPSQGCH